MDEPERYKVHEQLEPSPRAADRLTTVSRHGLNKHSDANATRITGQHSLTLKNMNPNLKRMEYAVRGPIVARAAELERQLKSGETLPFTEVIRANIGDCHACGQMPLTFIRQVLALCVHPDLLQLQEFPEDVKQRARRLLSGCKGGSLGSYSDSAGLEVVRRDVASYISARDGFDCDFSEVFLCTGASDGIKTILRLLLTGGSGPDRAGIMIPIPQYPLYSAALAEYNCHQIGYYLDESSGWSLDVAELRRALNEARPHCKPRALCVINPGNPTGQVLSRDNLEEIINFARDEGLFLLSDEVYQQNVYAEGMSFHSMRKVLLEMGEDYRHIELASFMSASKGYMGECGMRGGYCHVMNIDPDVKQQLLKAISVNLCPPVTGQVVLDCVVNPPDSGHPSFELFQKEKKQVLGDLSLKAKLVSELFNSIPGISCNQVMGAMYAFPRLHLPLKALLEAENQGVAPDVLYCFELLNRAGICVVPGSGFCQVPGTSHFRTTILPQVEDLKQMLERFRVFHLDFMQRYT